MKYLNYLILIGVGFAISAGAAPSEACRAHFKSCQEQGVSREECRSTMPDGCKKEMEARRGKFPGGKFPGGPPPFFEKCKDTPQCKDMGPGPEHFDCLKKNGSAECKAALQEARKQMP